eukprot:scaffold144908_cov56-Attheya_sp.AAC.3
MRTLLFCHAVESRELLRRELQKTVESRITRPMRVSIVTESSHSSLRDDGDLPPAAWVSHSVA